MIPNSAELELCPIFTVIICMKILPPLLPELISFIKGAVGIKTTQQELPNYPFDWWMNTLEWAPNLIECFM